MRPRRLAALAGLAALLAAPLAAEVRSAFKGADPSAMFIGGELWIDPTGEGDRLSAWASADLASWTKRGDLIRQKDIAWIGDDHARKHYLWSPDMVAANGHYYLYYSVGPQNPTPSRLGVAVCEQPQGPCADSGRPLLIGGAGFEAIDPMVFVDPKSGGRYLYAGGSAGAKLRVFELAPDMVTLVGEIPIDQPPAFTEAPFMHVRDGIYYLSYSSGVWNRASYSVHYAMAPSPTGPWKYRGPILQSDSNYKGPGHHSFVQDPRTGAWLIVYHRWEGRRGDGPYTDDRRVAIGPIRYDALGQIMPIRMSGP